MVTDRLAKGHVLRCKRAPFTTQKGIFYNAKDALLKRKRCPIEKLFGFCFTITGIFYLGFTYPLDNRTTVIKQQKQISRICLPHPFESSTGIIHPRFQGTDLNRQ